MIKSESTILLGLCVSDLFCIFLSIRVYSEASRLQHAVQQ